MNMWLRKIQQEREKQIKKNGYSPEHDDEHIDESIADASAHYISYTETSLYPWDNKFDTKSKHTREEQLVIGCAMAIAELERLTRAINAKLQAELSGKMSDEHKTLLNLFDSNETYQLAFGSSAGVNFLTRREFLEDYNSSFDYVVYDKDGQIVE